MNIESNSSGNQTPKHPTQTSYKSQYLVNKLQQYLSLRCIVKFEVDHSSLLFDLTFGKINSTSTEKKHLFYLFYLIFFSR